MSLIAVEQLETTEQEQPSSISNTLDKHLPNQVKIAISGWKLKFFKFRTCEWLRS